MNAQINSPSHFQDARFVPMSEHDLDRIAAIELDLYPFPWTRGNFADSLQAGYSTWTLRGPQDELLAYAVLMLALDEAHLLNLSVARPCQRHGLGWRMLDWMSARARENGARILFLEVRPTNIEAHRLYERYGFKKIGTRRDYYPAHGGREDADVMRIQLNSR